MRRLSTLGTSLFVLLAVTSAAAQDLPKAKEEPIPVAERQRLRCDWAGWSASACMFSPAVAFGFYSGARSTQALPDGDRKPWLRAARKAFPNEQSVELP